MLLIISLFQNDMQQHVMNVIRIPYESEQSLQSFFSFYIQTDSSNIFSIYVCMVCILQFFTLEISSPFYILWIVYTLNRWISFFERSGLFIILLTFFDISLHKRARSHKFIFVFCLMIFKSNLMISILHTISSVTGRATVILLWVGNLSVILSPSTPPPPLRIRQRSWRPFKRKKPSPNIIYIVCVCV